MPCLHAMWHKCAEVRGWRSCSHHLDRGPFAGSAGDQYARSSSALARVPSRASAPLQLGAVQATSRALPIKTRVCFGWPVFGLLIVNVWSSPLRRCLSLLLSVTSTGRSYAPQVASEPTQSTGAIDLMLPPANALASFQISSCVAIAEPS